MKDPVQQIYDGLAEDGQNEARNHVRPSVRFRASEASDCLRKLWYRLAGMRPAPSDAVSKMYGVCGDADHDITRQLMEHYGVQVDGIEHQLDGSIDEKLLVVKVFNHNGRDVTVSGRPDGLLPETPGGECLLEIKGTGFYPWKYLNDAFNAGGAEAALERVKVKHRSWYWQCMVSMRLTGYSRCYLLVKDRSSGTLGFHNEKTGERAGIYIDFDPALWEVILTRFAFVLQRLEAGQPPKPEFLDGSFECKFCNFYYMCHAAEKRRVRGLEPAIVYPGPQMEEHNGASAAADI